MKYEYVVNKDNVENRMFHILLADPSKPIEQAIIISAIGYSMELGTLTLTGQCPLDLRSDSYTMIVQYIDADGSVISLGNTKWDETINAGADFTISFKLPKEMFIITVVPVYKSLLKTVYKYITNIRRKTK